MHSPRFTSQHAPTLILAGAVLLMACAVKSSNSSDNGGGDGGNSGSSSKSSGGSSDSSTSPSERGGSGGESSSSPKAGGGNSSNSSSQAGASASISNSSSSVSGGGGSGGSGGKTSGGGGSSGGASGGASSSSSINTVNTCTQDNQCPNGHCVGNACVCWDSNAKFCNGACTDVKYNNNACGECGKVCPPSAPRCDYGNCKCDSPPCAGGGGAAGGSSSSSAAGGGAGAGGSSSSAGGAGASGASSSSSASNGGTISVQPITNGSDGWASRYWDCCKPSCGWSENAGGKPVPSCTQDNTKMSDAKAQSACNGGPAHVCWDMAPWSVSDNLSYGYVAFNGVPCGTCFQIQFTGGTHNGKADSCKALGGKTMFVQVTNIGGIGQGQFDIMIPGGGVGDFDACTKQWGSSDLGARYGGFLSACNGDKSCVQNKCNTVFASKPTLKAACNWFVDWYGAADNPTLKYQKVNCPAELTAKSGM